jgi:sporulation-control protein
MFKDFMARLGGPGSAQVDLVLDRTHFTPGERVDGKIVIKGGSVVQRINKIDVYLMLSFHAKGHHYTHPVTSVPFYQSFNVHPGEFKEFPFHFQLPTNLLVTGHSVSYYFKTKLDLAGAIDQTDRDHIEIIPPKPLQSIFMALDQLGFREKHDSREFNGYVQEFSFFPTGLFRDQIKELEFAVAIDPHGVRLLLEIELYSFGHEREIKREVFISEEQLVNLTQLAAYLQNMLHEFIHQGHHYTHSPYGYGHPGYGHHHGGYVGHRGHGVHHHHHDHDYYNHSSFSGLSGAIGGFAAGLLGGMLLDEMFDDHDDNDGGFFGNDDDDGFLGNDDDGGFFDDGDGDGGDWL